MTTGAPWYLVDAVPAVGEFVLDGPEGRHAATVRRTRKGEQLVLTDGRGNHCDATVTATDKSSLALLVSDLRTDPLPALRVTVVQALPKGERSDLAVDLLTEAGVDTVVPWQAERCVARWSGPKAQRGAEKWRMVAIQAAKQSRRAWVPTVRELASTPQVVDLIAAADAALVLHESGLVALQGMSLPASGELLLIIGPEGGVSPREIEVFGAAGAEPVRLGPQVLRTSTAGAVALGAIGVRTDRWS